MDAARTTGTETEEAEAWLGLKQKALQFTWQHPSIIRQIQKIAGIETYARAAVWTHQKRKDDLLKHVGTIRNDHGTGRSVDVYCNGWQPKKDNLRHEVKGTEFCLLFPKAKFLRGYQVGPLRPDIEMELNGQRYLIEIDCGTMTRKQVQRRWAKYGKFDAESGTILIVAVSNPRRGIDSEERMADLIRWSESMYGIAAFTTLERVIADPFGKVLWDESEDEHRWRPLKKPTQTS